MTHHGGDNPIDILKGAECYHTEYNGTMDKHGEITRTCARCGDCLDTDRVSELLYTRKGRLELLVAFMEREGMDIPDCWSV